MDCNKNEIEDSKKDSECVDKSHETNNNFETNKETTSSIGGDIDLSQCDGLKVSESREDRLKRMKEKSEIERQKRFAEIAEAQRQSNELRQRQQEDRRKKIEELKQREEERKRKVEQRRQEMDAKEKEKNENFLKRTKEREERALILQKQIRMTSAMSQSMTLTNQNRLTTSVHSSGASSGSEKCMKVFNRSSSGCDVDRVSSYVPQAACSKAAIVNTSRTGKKRPQVPDGFIEVDGNIIPANTRHAGCFVPYKGAHHRVKGVLAWGPPPDKQVTERSTSVSWWAGIDGPRTGRHHLRATSAHALLVGSHGHTHISTPQHLDKINCMEHHTVDIDITAKSDRSATDSAPKVPGRVSVKLMKTMSMRHLEPTIGSSNRSSGKDPMTTSVTSPRIRSSSRSRVVVAPTVRTPRQTTAATGDQALYDRLSKPRSGSHPPKDRQPESLEPVPATKTMSTSFSRPSPRATTKPVAAMVKQPVLVTTPASGPAKKTALHQRAKPKVSVTTAAVPDPAAVVVTETGETGQASVAVVVVPPPPHDSEPLSEVAPATATAGGGAEDSGKTRTKKITKTGTSTPSKDPEMVVSTDNGNAVATDASATVVATEEELYRQKLAEQRRLKREAKERQQEEQRKLEEEAKEKALAEKKRMEEETRRVIEEEERRIKEQELEEQEAIEKQRLEEDLERMKKDEIERELEEKRKEKLRSDDLDRMERKRRLEQIMIRVKKTDDSSVLPNEDCNVGTGDVMEPVAICDDRGDQLLEITLPEQGKIEEDNAVKEEPMNAWTIGNDVIRAQEDAAVEPMASVVPPSDMGDEPVIPCQESPATVESPAVVAAAAQQQPPPQFKSRLLQSMMAKGRLATSSNDIRRNSLGGINNSSNNGPDQPPSAADTDIHGHKRQSLILSQYNGDNMHHSVSYTSGISKMSTSMIDCDQSRNGLLYSSELDDRRLSNGTHERHSGIDHEVTVSGIGGRDMDGHSVGGTTCSKLAATEDRPSPVASQPLELS